MAVFGKKILYAEDDDTDAFLMERAFRAHCTKHTLLHVRDGIEAIAAIARDPPDLLILDIKMPRSGGFEILKWLRAQPPPLSQTPALLLSSSDHVRDVRRAQELGANGYLMKPASHHALGELMATLCNYITHHDAPTGWFEFPGNQLIKLDPPGRA